MRLTIAHFLYAISAQPSFSLKHALYQRFFPRDFYETWHFATRCCLAQLSFGCQPTDQMLIFCHTGAYIGDLLSCHFEPVPSDQWSISLLLPTFTVFSFLPIHLVTHIVLMRMGVPPPHARVTYSGFRWPIGQNNPAQGQNYFPLNFLAQKCPF